MLGTEIFRLNQDLRSQVSRTLSYSMEFKCSKLECQLVRKYAIQLFEISSTNEIEIEST